MNRKPPFKRALFAIAIAIFSINQSLADNAQPKPANIQASTATTPILTLVGPREKVLLSLSDLENMGMQQVKTSTFWPDDDGIYAGPLFLDVLKRAGLDEAEAVRIRARDGFSQILPRRDWEKWPILLATRRDGKPLSLREKGPIRIIYPRDMSLELSDTVYRLRWVWLIDRIEGVSGK